MPMKYHGKKAKKNGIEKRIHKDGTFREISWNENEKHGIEKWFYEDGTTRETSWKNGVHDGPEVTRCTNGYRSESIWKNGKRISEEIWYEKDGKRLTPEQFNKEEGILMDNPLARYVNIDSLLVKKRVYHIGEWCDNGERYPCV